MIKNHILSVGQISKRSGVNISTLHYYEQKGLINSTRNSGNQRRYAKDVLRRIAIIKSAQKVGISLYDIKQALVALPNNRTPTLKDWQKLSTKWKKQLNQKIMNLEKLRDNLTGCIGCGCLSINKCPMFNKDDKLAKNGPGAVLLK